ncbi:MAG: tRNA lysidine(34) synthetase TilS [Acidimicrobiia bacterium]|nr:tRNA lysidine(34) synthetase TilS [Acidimicrobiia bacterium]
MEATDRVLAAVRASLPAGPLLVALSGGADSAVAAWACLEVAGEDRVRLVHVDHGLADSETMRAAANLVAHALGMKLRVVAVQLPASSAEETHARVARMAALDQVVGDDEWIVTGHHSDDAAETVFGNLLRGAGALGLSGIGERRDRYVRPLLDVSSETVRAAADHLQLPYRNDPANVDLRHRRNVFRHRLLPHIEAELGRDVRGALQRTARILSSDDAYLEAQADQVPIRIDSGAALLPAPLLTSLPRPVASRAIRRAIRMVRPPYPGSAAEVASIVDVATAGGRRQLLSGWFVVREGVEVAIAPALELAPVSAVDLPVPGSIVFGYGHHIEAQLVQGVPGPALHRRDRAWLDAAALVDGAEVRSAAPGERLDVGKGSKTVRDALAEADVPLRHRATWPVVVTRGRIAWVPGVRIGAWARAANGAGSGIVMRWERTAG